MKLRIFLASALMAAAFTAVEAGNSANPNSLLQVTKVNVAKQGDDLVMALDVDARFVKVSRDKEVVFTPVLRSATGADSIVFPTIKVAGRNRYYSHLRNDDLADGDHIILAGSRERVAYRQDTPYRRWMSRSSLVMREDVGNCCDAPVPFTTTPIADLDLERRPVELPLDYVALLGDSTIERKAEGKAYVNFVVNRTELKPDYMTNPVEIGKIISSIDLVRNDPDAIITKITIKGYASPEGSYSNNVRLAMGRTQTLKEYVRARYAFDPAIMATDFEPEDWQGLRDWLVEHEIPNRDAILAIVDGPLEPDPRNSEIQRRYPEQYARILKEVYPWLRHSDYTILYTFKTYTDIEELKRLFASTPDRLRPVDFQRIAATYPVGSPEFDNVYMTAVEIWPNDELANLNAANIAMKRGDLVAASRYLTKAGSTPEAVYTRGALAARKADYNNAILYLEQAQADGVKQAADALKAVNEASRRQDITYHLLPINN